jgi:8-oxo-dGTP pyrophosphatase MutT (NUDIX family)
MKTTEPRQLPISTQGARKSELRTQFAALCYRMTKGVPEVLLITSRGRKRWIVPKGWPMDGMTPAEAVAQEAWEEAGVRGTAIDRCLGIYSYEKSAPEGDPLPCLAMLYPVKVKSLEKTYPEAGQRRRKWLSRKEAAKRVDEPELAALIRGFDPGVLKRPKA